MMHINDTIAKRYACAFLNTFEHALTQQDYAACQTLANMLRKNRIVYAYLTIPTISKEHKKRIEHFLIEKSSAPSSIHILIELLTDHSRIRLLDLVLHQIIMQHRERNNIMHFTITTSSPIDQKTQGDIATHLERLTGKAILTTFRIDHNLIEGIRIQSYSLLWEHSISQLLRKFNLSLQRQADV